MNINHFPPIDFLSLIELFEQLDAGDFEFCLESSEKAALLFHGRDTVNDEIIGPQALSLASQALAWAGAPWLPEASDRQERHHPAVIRGRDGSFFRVQACQLAKPGMIAIRKLDSEHSRRRPARLSLADRHTWAWAQHEAAQLAQILPETGALSAPTAPWRL